MSWNKADDYLKKVNLHGKSRTSHQKISIKKLFLKISQNLQENTCTRVSFLMKFIKAETLAQVFSSEFCVIFNDTFFTEHLLFLYYNFLL